MYDWTNTSQDVSRTFLRFSMSHPASPASSLQPHTTCDDMTQRVNFVPYRYCTDLELTNRYLFQGIRRGPGVYSLTDFAFYCTRFSWSPSFRPRILIQLTTLLSCFASQHHTDFATSILLNLALPSKLSLPPRGPRMSYRKNHSATTKDTWKDERLMP